MFGYCSAINLKGLCIAIINITLKDSIVIEHCSMSLIFIGSFQQSNSM